MIFYTTVFFLTCVSFSLFLFQHHNSSVHKSKSIKKWFSQLDMMKLSGLYKALTLTPSKTPKMKWNAYCELDLIAQHPPVEMPFGWMEITTVGFQHVLERFYLSFYIFLPHFSILPFLPPSQYPTYSTSLPCPSSPHPLRLSSVTSQTNKKMEKP